MSLWTEPFLRMWSSAYDFVPGIIFAIIILAVGYLIGGLLGWIVEKILSKIEIKKALVSKTNISKAIGGMNLPLIIGAIIKWGIFTLFLASAASVVHLEGLSNFMENLASWIPHLIAAVIVALAALVAGDYAEYKILETKIKSSKYVGLSAKLAIVFLGAIISLKEIGIDVSIVEHSFLVILGGVMLALAIAVGIGFSDVVKDESKDLVKKIKKKV